MVYPHSQWVCGALHREYIMRDKTFRRPHKSALAVVVLALCLTMLGILPALAAYAVTATIPVGSNPFGVGVNPVTNTIYVANFFSDSISVINGATNTVTATINVGSNPNGVGVNPVTNTIYAVIQGDTTVSVINGATNTVT